MRPPTLPLRSAALHRLAVPIVLAILASTGTASAADPIMPLAEVRPGMSCTGLSVVHGTEISSFGVQILDVIGDDTAYGGPRLLVRVSGPAVDATGVGPGFSGSPIICGGRTAGAISEAIGDYGNKVVLATPIEAILGARPRSARIAQRPRLLAGARPLTGPLTVSGLSSRSRALLATAAARSRRTVLAAPPGPFGGYPVQPLLPGAAVAATISTGDVSIGAVGTVAYRDGDLVYAFGHSLDGLGRRRLFLQDAYVFGVIGNPVGSPDLAMTYKLTSSGGHPVGTVTSDTFSAIAGTVGAGPPAIPLRVSARLAGGGREELETLLADERSLELGAGLSLVSTLATSTALDRLLGSLEPAALAVCMRFRVRERARPIGFCNDYFDGFAPLSDVTEAATLVEDYDVAPLHIRGASISIAARRDFERDVVVTATGPARVRPGTTIPVRVTLRRRGGGIHALTVKVRVPGDVRPGERTLAIAGNGLEEDSGDEFLLELSGSLSGARATASRAPTVARLARSVAALHRRLGITANFRGRGARVVLASDDVRYEGRARIKLRVVRARR